MTDIDLTTDFWYPCDGMIICPPERVAEIPDVLREKDIIALLDYFEDTPQLVGIRVGVNEDLYVATLNEAGTDFVRGDELAVLVDTLAERFQAEVRIGSESADHLRPESLPELPADHVVFGDDEAPHRIVEISSTPASSIPLLAALEGIDLGQLELGNGKRAIIAEIPADKSGWNFGHLPLLTLSASEDELSASLVVDNHFESVESHNWGMERILITGTHDPASVSTDLRDLVGAGPVLDDMAEFLPGADETKLRATAGLDTNSALPAVVAALGLEPALVDYLAGIGDLETLAAKVPELSVHRAGAMSKAISEGVDMVWSNRPRHIEEKLEPLYEKIGLADKPDTLKKVALGELLAGAALVSFSFFGPRKRAGLRVASALLGAMSLADSFIGAQMASYFESKK